MSVNIFPGPYSIRGPGQDRGTHRATERNRVWLVVSSPNLPAAQVTYSLRSRGGGVHTAMDGDQAWSSDMRDRKSKRSAATLVRWEREQRTPRSRNETVPGPLAVVTPTRLRTWDRGERAGVTSKQYRNPRVPAGCQF